VPRCGLWLVRSTRQVSHACADRIPMPISTSVIGKKPAKAVLEAWKLNA
jgi:hypothetical protein